MSAHSLSPALCPHIKDCDPLRAPVLGGGKRAAGRCWSLGCCPELAGRREGPVTDFTRWAQSRERAAGRREPVLPGESVLGLTPLPGWEGSCGTAGSKHGPRQTPPPASSPPDTLCPHPRPQWFWEGPVGRMPSSAPAWILLPQPLACAQGLPSREQGGAQVEQKQQGGASRQTWPCPGAGRTTPPAGAGFAASCSCPTQPLHKGLPTALGGWRSCLICNELIGAG